jgi:hypothetical protein
MLEVGCASDHDKDISTEEDLNILKKGDVLDREGTNGQP